MNHEKRVAELKRLGYLLGHEGVSQDGKALIDVNGYLMTYQEADCLIQGMPIDEVLKRRQARASGT